MTPSRVRRQMDHAFSSPRPTPKFYLDNDGATFSTKKERGTPRDSLPPRPPVKSAPPISRIFPHRPLPRRAQAVSFRSTDTSALSLQYNENVKDLYFNQCFSIICKLGAGSFGEVYKVRSREDGKFYAVKRSQERFRGESDRKRKLQEVAKHEKLPPHINCVHFYKAWEERQRLYLQIELCQTNLSNYGETHHEITEAMIWNILVDLLMAVKHLHDHNLIHMDIKPDNVFISNDGVCKMGDFGLVLDLTKESDFSEAQEGDPMYLAPELMGGKFGKPADIFSLGMSVLEMASDLDLPKGGEGWHLLRRGRLPEDLLQGKSFDLKYVIKQMLDPDPNSRPTVDQVMSFPCVRRVWKRRRRDYVINSAMSKVKSVFRMFLDFLLLMSFIFTYPFQKFTKRRCRSSSSSSHNTYSFQPNDSSYHTSGLDNSISDDECFDDDWNISNMSSMLPLDTSSSSDDLSAFSKPMDRRAFTTPALRCRPSMVPSPQSSSPVHLLKTVPKGTPNCSMNSSIESERSETPNMSFHTSFLDGDDAKTGIEPKNLLDMFEAASDEDL